MSNIDVVDLKEKAAGRWPEMLASLGGISADTLDGKHHPCPRCGGVNRFRAIDMEVGALFCNQCFAEKNGDGIAALGLADRFDLCENARYAGRIS